MSYDDYDEDEPAAPRIAIDASLTLNTPQLKLDTEVTAGYGRTTTLAELICSSALDTLAKGESWNSLAKRVQDITNEEIRAHVTELLKDALNGDLRRTNGYGEPYGEPTTLRALIAEEAKKAFTALTDRYNGPRETVIGKLVRDEVERALKAELAEAIKEERAKVVEAVRAQAAQLIAEAVAKGVGG